MKKTMEENVNYMDKKVTQAEFNLEPKQWEDEEKIKVIEKELPNDFRLVKLADRRLSQK